ncbi:hypothetical protein JRQ81_005037 [Phrynocephalus forsythii]|uniref:Uncharacterized protein n=1 Tax=Phrynocephalus forsythii TaxID=171643 RepID=A0A9Q1B609_9SAUR|nr:hypothetical protein JRQ81_005037 [Phrynocephalus forsythii]
MMATPHPVAPRSVHVDPPPLCAATPQVSHVLGPCRRSTGPAPKVQGIGGSARQQQSPIRLPAQVLRAACTQSPPLCGPLPQSPERWQHQHSPASPPRSPTLHACSPRRFVPPPPPRSPVLAPTAAASRSPALPTHTPYQCSAPNPRSLTRQRQQSLATHPPTHQVPCAKKKKKIPPKNGSGRPPRALRVTGCAGLF